MQKDLPERFPGGKRSNSYRIGSSLCFLSSPRVRALLWPYTMIKESVTNGKGIDYCEARSTCEMDGLDPKKGTRNDVVAGAKYLAGVGSTNSSVEIAST